MSGTGPAASGSAMRFQRSSRGFIPDSISTDLHTANFTVLSMTQVMSKFLAMGIPLNEIIRRSTLNPALEIRRPELGTLSVGKEADIAVLEVLNGKFSYIDCGRARMDGTVKLTARMTVRAGRILYDPSGLSMVEWKRPDRSISALRSWVRLRRRWRMITRGNETRVEGALSRVRGPEKERKSVETENGPAGILRFGGYFAGANRFDCDNQSR